ncbi:Monosaccharide-sensing protein 2 [Dichanthelium oligosanthes]|uniref:Monosaccharide-sensing protein 2 n=1 Tax=Dichanthelium oligosanthes TaxID=888268 RepID=A0A1E5V9H3_9POAL|nr:Monosaccharide-sensing protein 2 [Dichanthelium oligosanthes]
MRGAVLVAIAAAIGNMLQGWDNATIAGAVLYIKREFHLEAQPAIEGLVVATSLIGATVITTFSGPVSDSVGRRPMLVASSLLYFLAGLLMLWSPNVYVLLLSRLVDGFAIGLAVTLVPVYISETAPPEIRGLLNTLPQFTGSGGMFLSYCMVFAMTLAPHPDWRLMLGALSLLSLAYLLLTVCYLPESPRWLVSKGRMKEARAVLQMLRGRDDVSGEMALLVEGLGTPGDTAIEEYIVGPPPPQQPHADAEAAHDSRVTLYGPERGMSWVAQPLPLGAQGSMLGSAVGLGSRQGSMLDHLRDPVVALLGSVHDLKAPAPDQGSRMRGGSMLFSNLGSMLSFHDKAPLDWDEENAVAGPDEQEDGCRSDDDGGMDLHAPLLDARGLSTSMTTETATTTGIGGGWQLAWKYADGPESGVVKRMYLHEEAGGGEGGVHAAALVSQSALYLHGKQQGDGPALVHPAAAAEEEEEEERGSRWRELLEPGVRHALVCGVTMQVLQQFSGINGVLYYTPQILDQAGVSVLLASLGLSADSTSILISGLTTLLMLPTIGVAMRLMDASGRRSLLLWTIPVLIASLSVLVAASMVPMAAAAHAAVATGSVMVYLCCFVMGFGPIPNILCAEIFPTRVRGLCIAICSLAFWLGDIAVTYSLPVMLNCVGLTGVFGFYALVCCVALAFVALRVPETKGLPLEVIIEFFNIGARGLPPGAATAPAEEAEAEEDHHRRHY